MNPSTRIRSNEQNEAVRTLKPVFGCSETEAKEKKSKKEKGTFRIIFSIWFNFSKTTSISAQFKWTFLSFWKYPNIHFLSFSHIFPPTKQTPIYLQEKLIYEWPINNLRRRQRQSTKRRRIFMLLTLTRSLFHCTQGVRQKLPLVDLSLVPLFQLQQSLPLPLPPVPLLRLGIHTRWPSQRDFIWVEAALLALVDEAIVVIEFPLLVVCQRCGDRVHHPDRRSLFSTKSSKMSAKFWYFQKFWDWELKVVSCESEWELFWWEFVFYISCALFLLFDW